MSPLRPLGFGALVLSFVGACGSSASVDDGGSVVGEDGATVRRDAASPPLDAAMGTDGPSPRADGWVPLPDDPPLEPTYVVAREDENASDDNPGTLEEPLLTIRRALELAVAGDVIEVRTGVYDAVRIARSGEDGAPIVLAAFPGEHPVIDASDSGDRAIEIRAGSGTEAIGWLTIQGFELRNAPYEGIKYYNAHHLTIRHNEIHHNVNQGVLGSGGHDIVVDGNVIHDNGLACPRCDKRGTKNRWHHGMYAHGQHYVVVNNVFYLNAAFGLQISGDPYDPSQHPGPEFAGASDWLVAHNVFAFQKDNSGAVVQYEEATGVRFYNNVFYMNSRNTENTNGIHFSGAGGGHVIENNLFFTDRDVDQIDSPELYTERNNVYGSDPAFVDDASFDFRLTPGSPAIDRGLDLPEVARDFLGVTRPQGPGFDIGAFELVP